MKKIKLRNAKHLYFRKGLSYGYVVRILSEGKNKLILDNNNSAPVTERASFHPPQ